MDLHYWGCFFSKEHTHTHTHTPARKQTKKRKSNKSVKVSLPPLPAFRLASP